MNVGIEYHHLIGRGRRGRNGWMRDMNFQGAWIELPERVPPGSPLKLTVETPMGKLALSARIAWARPDSPSTPHLHGVLFTGVNAKQRDQLRALFTQEHLLPVRVLCELAATCQRQGGRTAAVPGTIQDLSERGACIAMPESLAPGAQLRILAATRLGQLDADTRVVWADEKRADLPPGTVYRHGLQFLRIHPMGELPLRGLLYGYQ
jgi:hypothetical protein